MASNNQPSVPDASKVADRKTWAIKPKDLTIIWSEERNYWRIHEGDGPAELLQVCWLEVRGSVPNVTKGKTYEIRFKLSKKANAFGWDHSPVFIMAKIGNESEDQLSEEISLSNLGEEPDETTAKFQVRFDSNKKTEDPNSDTLYFGLYEVWAGNWKGGLIIHEAVVEEVTADHDSASTSSSLGAKSN